VVGDTTLAEIVPLLDKQLGDWKGEGAAGRGEGGRGGAPGQAARVLIDQPGAVQANLFAGQVVRRPPSRQFDPLRHRQRRDRRDFTSRLNMNLREDKHWSYGARSGTSNAVGQRPWMASAPVQIDKTGRRWRKCARRSPRSPMAAPATAPKSKHPAIQIRGLPGARPPHRWPAPSVRSCSSSARTTMCCAQGRDRGDDPGAGAAAAPRSSRRL
jgi:hypothetical protein